jgi:hypothetical protein
VRRVDVQDAVERPRAAVAVQGRVRTRVVRLDRRVGESRNKLLDVTHAGEPEALSHQKVRSMLYDTRYKNTPVRKERTLTRN